jgi:hypothetical protein
MLERISVASIFVTCDGIQIALPASAMKSGSFTSLSKVAGAVGQSARLVS